MAVPARLENSFNTNSPWLFLSPHLDDAVLSCASLMESSAARRDITVATVFTEAQPPPHTRAARNFLQQCARRDAVSLFEDRKREDETALSGLGARHLHFGATDALFRQRQKVKVALGPVARMLPELVHLYPTYRFDIALGRVSRNDRPLVAQLRHRVSDLLVQSEAELLFCPLGVGRHVDHLITRAVGTAFPGRVVYYSDFPYNQTSSPDGRFLRKHRLTAWTWATEPARKEKHIYQYGSQAPALFPDGSIPVVPETYFSAE